MKPAASRKTRQTIDRAHVRSGSEGTSDLRKLGGDSGPELAEGAVDATHSKVANGGGPIHIDRPAVRLHDGSIGYQRVHSDDRLVIDKQVVERHGEGR